MTQQPPVAPGAMPPPIAPQVMYHIAIDGVQHGPFPLQQMAQMVQAGQITCTTMVWTAGMPTWAPANTVSALAELFGPPAPPPIMG